MGGAGKGPGIGWSRAQPKYSWEANLYATRWFCADRSRTEQQWKIIISRTVCQYFRVCAIQKLKIHLIAYYSNATRTGSTLSRTKYVKCFRVETSCYRVVLRLKFIVTVELLDQAESDFVQCQTKMRAFASRICSEFKQIGLNWNRIVHQNTLWWSLVFSTCLNPEFVTAYSQFHSCFPRRVIGCHATHVATRKTMDGATSFQRPPGGGHSGIFWVGMCRPESKLAPRSEEKFP